MNDVATYFNSHFQNLDSLIEKNPKLIESLQTNIDKLTNEVLIFYYYYFYLLKLSII